MSDFEIDEVVVGCNHVAATFRNGAEAVVIGPLAMRAWQWPDGTFGSGQVYIIQWEDGEVRYSWPDKIRRRRPPSDSHERTYMEKWRDMAGKAPQREGEPA